MRLWFIVSMLIVFPFFGVGQDNVPVANKKVNRLTIKQWTRIYEKRKAAANKRYHNFYHKKHYAKVIRKMRRIAKRRAKRF